MLEGGKALKVLARFYESLAYAIRHPDSVTVGEYPYPYTRATKIEPVKMISDEVDAWDRAFGITGKVIAARAGLVAVETGIPLAELDKVTYDNRIKAAKNGHIPNQDVSGSVFYGGKCTKFFPFEADSMELYVQPHAVFGKATEGKTLQTASLQLRFYVKDKDGRLAVAVPVPIKHGFPAYGQDEISPGAIVVPYEPIAASLSFNTSAGAERQNKLEIEINTGTNLRMRAGVHDVETIGKIRIPNDDGIDVFFGQLDRFLKPLGEGGKTIDDLFQTEGMVR